MNIHTRLQDVNKKTLNLTEGKISKVLIAFILPILAGSLIQQLYTTVDAVIVGQFAGKSGLAAIDSVWTLFKFPLNFLSGLSAGATIIISRFFGEKNEEELDCSIHTSFTIAIVLGSICSAAGVIFAPVLLKMLSVPEDIFSSTLIYVRIYFAGIWAMTLYNMVAGILRALGDSKSPFYILIACCIVNVIGDLIFVGGLRTGVAGAAAATVAAQIISALLALRRLAMIHGHCEEKIWKIRFCREHLGIMVRLGLPLGLQGILYPIANSIVQASVNGMGTDMIAAWSVCGKLDLLIWLVADAMNPALSTYVAQNLGAGRYKRIDKGIGIGVVFSAGTVALISLGLFFFSGPIGKLFISAADAEVLTPYIVRFMKMMAPFYIFYAITQAFSGACCGYGNTTMSMFTTMLFTCGLRIVCIFFIMPMFRSMECIVWIYVASWISTGIAFFLLFFFYTRRRTTA